MFSTVLGQATEACEPTARNSNLLPVKANGLVRFRSPASSSIVGIALGPRLSVDPSARSMGGRRSSIMFCSMWPTKIDRIAGARFVGTESQIVGRVGDRGPQDVRMEDPGARTTAVTIVRNSRFSCTVRLGDEDYVPRIRVDNDQLLCLPDHVDAGERLLVEQADQSVLACDLADRPWSASGGRRRHSSIRRAAISN